MPPPVFSLSAFGSSIRLELPWLDKDVGKIRHRLLSKNQRIPVLKQAFYVGRTQICLDMTPRPWHFVTWVTRWRLVDHLLPMTKWRVLESPSLKS